MVSRPRFTRPPKALSRPGIRFDNIAIVPASVLFRPEVRAAKDALPHHGVLLCARRHNRRQRRIIAQVSMFMKAQGRQVKTILSEQLMGAASQGQLQVPRRGIAQ